MLMQALLNKHVSPSLLCFPMKGYDANNKVFFQWKVPVNNDWVCRFGVNPRTHCYSPCPEPPCPNELCLGVCHKVTKTLTYQRAVPLNRDGTFRLSADYYTCAEWGTSLPQYSWLSAPGSRDALLAALSLESSNVAECLPFQFLKVKAVINVNRLFAREDSNECVPDPEPTDKLFDRAGGTGKTARAVTADGDGLRGFAKLFTCDGTEEGGPGDIPGGDDSDLSDIVPDSDASDGEYPSPSPSPSPFPPNPSAPPPSPSPSPSPS
ncbi:hypothetical protein DUNSADRAFT_7600, partial [Dunaliella salina]